MNTKSLNLFPLFAFRRNLLAFVAALALAGAAGSTRAAAPATPGTTDIKPPTPAAGAMDLQQSLNQLNKASASDPQLKSIGTDLTSKISSLSASLGSANIAAQSQLTSVVTSLVGNKGAATMTSLQKLSQAKLTPEQMQLSKDAYHLGSAYVVQKNFGSLEGSQSEVAEVVKGLRKGSITESLPALKQISQDAKLTQPQKDILTAITDQYVPGIKKVGETFKGLPGFQKPTPAAPDTKQ
jgi:hypothetical protein